MENMCSASHQQNLIDGLIINTLGICTAEDLVCDIEGSQWLQKSTYANQNKWITLIHSRKQVLPRIDFTDMIYNNFFLNRFPVHEYSIKSW